MKCFIFSDIGTTKAHPSCIGILYAWELVSRSYQAISLYILFVLDGCQQSCKFRTQTIMSQSNNPISPLSPPVIPCFQLPFCSDSTRAINTGIPIKHLPSAATRDDSCDKSSSVDHEYSDSLMTSTGAEVASRWSVESAVMMRYSRWLMSDDEITKTSYQPLTTIYKPVKDEGCVVCTIQVLVGLIT